MSGRVCAALLLLANLYAFAASAQTVPFTEDFLLDEAGWTDNPGLPLDYVAGGGPDGSSHASGSFDFTDFVEPFPGAGPIVFRAHDETSASGGALEGDWNTAGVVQLHAWVRHDAPVDLSWILRIANSFNFPAAAFDAVDPVVPPNTWTQLVFQVDADSPYCIPESTNPEFACADALANVAHVQLGTDAPQQLVDDEVLVTLDVDQVSIVPEPGATASLVVGLTGLALLARRRSARAVRAQGDSRWS